MSGRGSPFVTHALYVQRSEKDRLFYIHNHNSWPAGDRAITGGYRTAREAVDAAKRIGADWDRAKAGTKK